MISIISNTLKIENGSFVSNKAQVYSAGTGNIEISKSSFVAEGTGGVATLTGADISVSDSTVTFNCTATSAKPGTFYNYSTGDIVYKNVNFVMDSTVGDYDTVGFNKNGSVAPKSITFENCEFTGKTRNCSVNIFALQNNAVVTFKNCHFENCSNPIRFDNDTAATGISFVVEDCKFDKWESANGYDGMFMFQDATHDSVPFETAVGAKIFGGISITIKNSYGPYGKIVALDDVSSYYFNGNTASTNPSQLCYVYIGYKSNLTSAVTPPWQPQLIKYSEYGAEYHPSITIE